MANQQKLNSAELKEIAKKVRKDILRMTSAAESGHPGGSLSVTDLLVALYFNVLKHNPSIPMDNNRDRVVLSKGHAAPALYSCLSRAGYFPSEELMTLRKIGSRLQGHPERGVLPGVEASTGPLGQGLSFGNGIALVGKTEKKNYTVFVVLGDGELQEGQIWEAAMTSNHHKLDNIVAIVDNNNLQIDGSNDEVKTIKPLAKKWEGFGWNVIEIDGHDMAQILLAYAKAKSYKKGPTVIIAHTIKGKGVKSMENKVEWHGKACAPGDLENCIKEIDSNE